MWSLYTTLAYPCQGGVVDTYSQQHRSLVRTRISCQHTWIEIDTQPRPGFLLCDQKLVETSIFFQISKHLHVQSGAASSESRFMHTNILQLSAYMTEIATLVDTSPMEIIQCTHIPGSVNCIDEVIIKNKDQLLFSSYSHSFVNFFYSL
jgi:hypothetical protein